MQLRHWIMQLRHPPPCLPLCCQVREASAVGWRAREGEDLCEGLCAEL